MAANYNNSAWFYDRLSCLIYGRALINAQVYLLQYIPASSKILIIGGGTGWILEEITKIHPAGLNITYIEVAPAMMSISQKRQTGTNKVTFFNNAVENINLQTNFDIVITPFLFDNFKEQTLQKVFEHIHQSLKSKGLWLNADFQLTGKWWQRLLLRSMFLFFRILCGIEASSLPDIEQQFEKYSYENIAGRTFYGDFIISKIYTKMRNDSLNRYA
ncbi:ubiquinone/menaquinone biosynthesis C-methylase UbiE [Mucilaginibacter frigoritolerans]|uniref:Ubiquinone/menaquinone biosynthesis C-methylase UbiE n=1 Tax=Mucilaginibacter frigoritolerans TaxID=652788 RepID=A0A562U2H3_9SPHI|nr:class I SAM-dependent methyltransferase [Mucilaginibacter frigoritolerans]TWJ00063.1 ubiquinone/menaquinone biosynthesis C-methylase UbiE [Mucilaginibacter frigoritolerans]